MVSSDINKINFTSASLGSIGGVQSNTTNPNVESLLSAIFKNLGINSQTPTKQPEQNVDKILEIAYKDGTLAQILDKTCSDPQLRARVLEILNPENENIIAFCDDNDPGTAQWNKESGRVIINTSEKTSINGLPRGTWAQHSTASKLKILIHEAMHGAQGTVFDTQKEELICEMTAIKTAATLAKEKNLPDVPLYPPNYTLQALGNMPDEELQNILQEKFINGAYSNRIKDETGAVTITGANETQIDIPAGSKIKIDDKEFEIGQTFIEGWGAYSGTVCNFFAVHDERPVNIGIATFDNVEPQEQELNNPQIAQFINPQEGSYKNAVIVIDGKEFNMKIFGYNEQFANFLSNSQ